MPVFKCTCKSDYQDRRYGVDNRLMNPCKATGVYRCTVCGKNFTKIVVKKEKKSA